MVGVDPRQREEDDRKVQVVVHRTLCWPRPDTTLVSAVKEGSSLGLIEALLRHGAHTEQVDEIGLTPLLAATRAGNTAVIEALLDAGADVNSYGRTTWTPLHFAAHLGDPATIETLVTRGGDLAARTALKGKSPLHIAAGHAKARAVQDLLLRWGADETQLDGRGRSASDLAGALKNVFERGHLHAEKVARIKVLLANAPRDRKWIRRRAVVMLVSRLRGEIAVARERGRGSSGGGSNSSSSSRAESKGVKKRGGGAAAGELAAGHTGQLAAAAPSSSAAEEERQAPRDVMRRTAAAAAAAAAAAGEHQASLPHGMEAFRDAVIRLGGEDDVGIFHSVVGFL